MTLELTPDVVDAGRCPICGKTGLRALGNHIRKTHELAVIHTHGTARRYQSGCRCVDCTAANSAKHEEDRSRTRRGLLAAGDPRHGTLNGYDWWGCRCSACRGAFASYQQQRRAKKRAANPHKHGTQGAWKAHLAASEEPCAECVAGKDERAAKAKKTRGESPAGRRKIPAEDLPKILKRRGRKETLLSIAADYGCADTTLSQFIRNQSAARDAAVEHLRARVRVGKSTSWSDEALADWETAIREAIAAGATRTEAARAAGTSPAKVIAICEREVREDPTPAPPIEPAVFLSGTEVAQRLGLQPATWRSYHARRQCPPPDVMIGDVPGWLPTTVDGWQRPAHEKGRGR